MIDFAAHVVSQWSHAVNNPDICWNEIDQQLWTSPLEIIQFNAAMYYLETLREDEPAHLISNSCFSEWQMSLRSHRFSVYDLLVRPLQAKVDAIMTNDLVEHLDPFWIAFPNNINLKFINEEDTSLLMLLSGYSASILNFAPLGALLYAYGHPIEWCSNSNALDQADAGLQLLKKPILPEIRSAHQFGTFQ